MSDFSVGERFKVTLFGQSHGSAIGCVIEGFPAGITPDGEKIAAFMARRAPGQNAWSTPRKEADLPEILSGLNENGQTCGAPITAIIRNSNTHSSDYAALRDIPRPGHADYTARCKYGSAWDGRGGGQFSARLTAPLCFAGVLAKQFLEEKSIFIAAHIARIGSVEDEKPNPVQPSLPMYAPGAFPVIDAEQGEKMKAEIEAARSHGDSIDGAVECFVTGLPIGLGGPYFGGLEGKLAQALFGIPAVKGVHFGDTQSSGSENNDAFTVKDGTVRTVTNHCGGILGGITNGMPVCFTVSFKPTPSISIPQQSVNLQTMEENILTVKGRHDPCVVPRAVPVVEAVTAIIMLDIFLQGA
ncbi:MAG: chorismate synthase [Clostridia bacterium]|nr:chorismate synthase [Clostridia bacterium]